MKTVVPELVLMCHKADLIHNLKIDARWGKFKYLPTKFIIFDCAKGTKTENKYENVDLLKGVVK